VVKPRKAAPFTISDVNQSNAFNCQVTNSNSNSKFIQQVITITA